MHNSMTFTIFSYLVAPGLLLLISLRRESSRKSKIFFVALAIGFAGTYAALASVSFFWETHPGTEGIGASLAATICLAAGLLKWFRGSKVTDTHSDGTSPGSRFSSLKNNKWNMIGLCYMAIAIGLFVLFEKQLILFSVSTLDALWATWGFLLLVGVEQVGGILLRQDVFTPPGTGIWKRYLIQPLVVLAGLAGMFIPLLIFPLRRYLIKITAQNPITLPTRRALLITLTWFVWGIAGAVLAGIYHQQAIGFILLGTIFITPALIGGARFAGMVAG